MSTAGQLSGARRSRTIGDAARANERRGGQTPKETMVPVTGGPDPTGPARGVGTLELRDYIDVVRRRLPLLILVVLLGGALGGLRSVAREPAYTSRASVLVKPINVDVGRSTIRPDQLVNTATEREVMRSASVAQRVTEVVDPPAAPEELLARLTVQVVEGTQVLQLSYTDSDPARAQQVAQAFADEYLDLRRDEALSEVRRRSEDIDAGLAASREELAAVNAALGDAEAGSAEYARAQSQRDLLLSQINQLQTQLADVASLTVAAGEVIGPATLPTSSAAPGPATDVGLGLALGLLVGLPLAFLWDRLDDRLLDQTDLWEAAHLPVLGSLPAAAAQEGGAGRLPILEDPNGLVAESFRRLRMNLLSLAAERRATTFMVTSPLPGEGKSQTAANLAVSLAQSGEDVLLVSADLRLPTLHRVLGLENGPGLSDVLSGRMDLAAVTQRLPAVPSLRVVTSGTATSSPGDLLRSVALSRLIRGGPRRQGLVVFDAPPVLAVADCLELAHLVDGVLVATRARATRRRQLLKALQQLQTVDATVLGTVLVNAPQEDVAAFNVYAAHSGEEPPELEEERSPLAEPPTA